MNPSARRDRVRVLTRARTHRTNERLQIVSGTVKYLVDGAIRVELSGGIAGVIPNLHLSDHVGHCEAIRATLSKGSVLKEMLVWTKNDVQKRITLSCKPSLIEAAKSGQLLQAREDFTSGTLATVRAASAPLACTLV